MALAAEHWMRRWYADSGALSQRAHVCLSRCILELSLSFVGSAFEAILHKRVLILSGALIFQSFFHSVSLKLLVTVCWVEIWYTDLTKNAPLELGTQISLSSLRVVGRGSDKMAWAEEGSKI